MRGRIAIAGRRIACVETRPRTSICMCMELALRPVPEVLEERAAPRVGSAGAGRVGVEGLVHAQRRAGRHLLEVASGTASPPPARARCRSPAPGERGWTQPAESKIVNGSSSHVYANATISPPGSVTTHVSVVASNRGRRQSSRTQSSCKSTSPKSSRSHAAADRDDGRDVVEGRRTHRVAVGKDALHRGIVSADPTPGPAVGPWAHGVRTAAWVRSAGPGRVGPRGAPPASAATRSACWTRPPRTATSRPCACRGSRSCC